MTKRPNGLEVGRIRTPIGVVGIIYESRPNVTADAAGLCLKAGNAIILRGGEEALNSNRVIARVISEAAVKCGLPAGSIQLVDSEDKEAAIFLMKMSDYLDVLIPRGGKGLKMAVMENARVPYIMTGMGNCHVYVDEFADLEQARQIVFNAKVQRPSVCNAAETLLVHSGIASQFLPLIVEDLQKAGVEIRACSRSREIVDGLKAATEADWDEEYLDLILAVKIVDGWKRPLSISTAMEPVTVKPLLVRITAMYAASWPLLMRLRFMPTLLPVLPMAMFLDLARKWGSAPRNYMPGALWACRN